MASHRQPSPVTIVPTAQYLCVPIVCVCRHDEGMCLMLLLSVCLSVYLLLVSGLRGASESGVLLGAELWLLGGGQ